MEEKLFLLLMVLLSVPEPSPAVPSAPSPAALKEKAVSLRGLVPGIWS
jgi:hypothetical protein